MPAIHVDLTNTSGPLPPVNGIDNGPVCFGSLIDSSRYYRQAAFPYCRLHDTNYPHPREVDIPTIFRDFDADPDDPASYFFGPTDAYLHEVLATGAKIIYRLGISIEHPKLKLYTAPPKDAEKWAKICLQIARHCNEGWANGYHMGIEYWEVWNEPDHLAPERGEDKMWAGTPEEYCALYAATARLFKAHMPTVKIGGYGACGMLSPALHAYFINFLRWNQARGIPLDFFSWHTYTSRLEDIHQNARIAREALDAFGYTHTESMCNEWNYMVGIPRMWESIFAGDGAPARREVFAETSGVIGAAFTAAALIDMVDLPVDIATFYDGQPTNLFGTLFDRYGLPTKQFFAFDAFARLRAHGPRAALSCDAAGVHALATTARGGARVLIANWEGRTQSIALHIGGLVADVPYRYTVHALDETRDLAVVTEAVGRPSALPTHVYVHQHSVVLVCVEVCAA